MLAQDPGGTITYVPKCERELPEEDQFRVFLKLFTVADQERFANRAGKKPGTLLARILREGIVGWENLRSATGEIVPYDGPASIDRLRLRVRRELGDVLLDMNELDEDDEKN